MNRDLLQKLIECYADKYEVMNDREHHEVYKWDAISHFQKYWDIDADDFGAMFKKAVANAENLIDDNVTSPDKGIVFLCENSLYEMEKVRTEFQKLLENDHSDYDKRQNKIAAFVRNINKMLEAAGCEEWKFRQNTRAVIMYLAFIDPDDNYMFREAEVKALLSYVRYSEKIGSGKSFSLKSYYQMCDAITDVINDNEELIEMVNERLESEAEATGNTSICEVDAENHILVFDLIYCAANYEFYEEIQARATRAFTVTPLKNDEKEAQQLKWEMDKAVLAKKLELAKNAREELSFPELTGKQAKHKKFGSGEIIEQSDKYLKVRFKVGEKKFILPGAIVQGFLNIEESAVAETLQRMDELDKNIEKLTLEIKMIDLGINGIK